jgi:hypothetical protein
MGLKPATRGLVLVAVLVAIVAVGLAFDRTTVGAWIAAVGFFVLCATLFYRRISGRL